MFPTADIRNRYWYVRQEKKRFNWANVEFLDFVFVLKTILHKTETQVTVKSHELNNFGIFRISKNIYL